MLTRRQTIGYGCQRIAYFLCPKAGAFDGVRTRRSRRHEANLRIHLAGRGREEGAGLDRLLLVLVGQAKTRPSDEGRSLMKDDEGEDGGNDLHGLDRRMMNGLDIIGGNQILFCLLDKCVLICE